MTSMAKNTPHGTKHATNGRARNTTLHFQSVLGQQWFLAHTIPAIVEGHTATELRTCLLLVQKPWPRNLDHIYFFEGYLGASHLLTSWSVIGNYTSGEGSRRRQIPGIGPAI